MAKCWKNLTIWSHCSLKKKYFSKVFFLHHAPNLTFWHSFSNEIIKEFLKFWFWSNDSRPREAISISSDQIQFNSKLYQDFDHFSMEMIPFNSNLGYSRPLFLYVRLFNTIDSKQMFNLNFADDWIWTADVWFSKRPLNQQSHYHCPRSNSIFVLFF